MSYRTARVALALAAGATSLLLGAPADAGVVGCTTSNVNIPAVSVNGGGLVNCTLDRTGTCLFYYDPLFSFPTRVVSETTEVTFCTVF